MILLTILSLPFMLREPIDLPPIVSVELIQISDKTNIPYAPKARKIIEESKKKEIINSNEIAALIDKAKEQEVIKQKNFNKLTQSSVKNSFATGLSLS
jgi:hypothetical protein